MLIPVDVDVLDALARGVTDHAIAPGWPHDDTATALGFVRSGGTQFLVIDDAGCIAGECGTKTRTRPDGSVEIGYGLAAPSRGRGLGRQAVTDLVTWLEQQADVKVIEAEIHVSNIASRRLVERLGFVAADGEQGGYLQYRRALQDGRT